MGASAENADPPTTCDAFLGGCLMLHQPKKGHRAGHDAILLAAFCRAKKDSPRAVRAKAALLADYQTQLRSSGIPLSW